MLVVWTLDLCMASVTLQACSLQDVVLLDTLLGTWDANNPSLYYSNLEAGSVYSVSNNPSPWQLQQLDPSYK